jgi:hypothetical protein
MDAILPSLEGYDRKKCAELNDKFRKEGPQLNKDAIILTHALRSHMTENANGFTFARRCDELNRLIAGYDFSLSWDNDPHGERDMGFLDFMGERVYFKIDYYDLDLKYRSDNPADPTITSRVMTIMLASDY